MQKQAAAAGQSPNTCSYSRKNKQYKDDVLTSLRFTDQATEITVFLVSL